MISRTAINVKASCEGAAVTIAIRLARCFYKFLKFLPWVAFTYGVIYAKNVGGYGGEMVIRETKLWQTGALNDYTLQKCYTEMVLIHQQYALSFAAPSKKNEQEKWS